jgi:hypothetical protein
MLAHELTHVAQRPAARFSRLVSRHDDPAEREAAQGIGARATRTALIHRQQPGEKAAEPRREPIAAQVPASEQDTKDRELLEEVLKTGDANRIFDIRNPNVASESQKIQVLWLCDKLSFPLYRAIYSKWWGSFGDKLPEVATANMDVWVHCVQRDSGLVYLPQVKSTQDAFLADVAAAAKANLEKNRAYVTARKETLGLEGSGKTIGDKHQAAWRNVIQDMAWQVWELKQQQAKLLKTIVGYRPLAFAPPDPIYFNPERPEKDRFAGVHGTRSKWEDLKLAWDTISAEIARIAGKYPEIYGALASKKPDDELLQMSRLIPGAFQKNTGRLLDEMLVRIADASQKIGKSINLLDLKPLIARLLQGGAVPSQHKWNEGFDQWAAKQLVGAKGSAEKTEDVAVTALGIIGLLVATFASGGLALLVGGTLAVGAPIAKGISDWSKANELDEAAKATPKSGTDLVSQAQADTIHAKAVANLINGIFNAITLGSAAGISAIRGTLLAARLEGIGEMTAAEAAPLIEKALGQLGAAKTVSSSGKTIEELLAIVGEKSPAVGPLRAYEAELLAKSLADITPQELAASRALQNRLFNAAKDLQARQQELADSIRARLGITAIRAESILKRPDLESFIKGVLEKAQRKEYEQLGRMDDIVRGRFDVPDRKSVGAVAKALQEQEVFEVLKTLEPREELGVVRYPRYHIILRDKATGLTHEWQVGTEALSRLYETPGIEIPEKLGEAAAKLGKTFHPDLHDMEYDLFQAINKAKPDIGSKYGLPDFIAKVAKASERAGAEGAAFKDLPRLLAELQGEAGNIVARLVDGEGAEWVVGFFH